MSVCGNRTDSPGFFTPCTAVLHGPCVCAEQVRAEQLEEAVCATPSA